MIRFTCTRDNKPEKIHQRSEVMCLKPFSD